MAVRGRDFDDFARDLRRLMAAIGPTGPEGAHEQAAVKLAQVANSAARGSAQGSIRASGTGIEFGPGSRGDARANLFGASRRFGWYSQPKYVSSAGRQFEPWVGASWQVGDTGGKPYQVGDAMNRTVEDVLELYGDEVEQLAVRTTAFPIPS